MMGEMNVKSDKNIYKGYATMRMSVTRSHGGDESQREANDVCSKQDRVTGRPKFWRASTNAVNASSGSSSLAEYEPLQLGQELCGDYTVCL